MGGTVEGQVQGSIQRSGRDHDGLPVVVLRPQAPLKVVGPGRKERSYRDRIEELERDRERRRALEHELEVARLVERGTGRLVDRLEERLDSSEDALERSRQQMNRLLVTIGGLQREGEHLRLQLQQKERALAALEAPRGGWRRLFTRRRKRS